eukprot:10414092-Ditylum_brightwellii.AAC.1
MKKRPTEAQLQDLEQSLENNGYTCGNKIKVGGGKFYARYDICCGDTIDAYYYNPLKGTRSGRIVTDEICSVCYIDKDLVSPNEIRKLRDLQGARKNKKHEKQQKEINKRRHLSNH